MNKKSNKIFSIFWLISGSVWALALIRHTAAKDDIAGSIIYLLAAVISFILAFAYFKDFVK